MSANNDTVMTRFLFAILRQKNLKDIDWGMVADDPILAQPITNGHAARMRYSRFRGAMLGLEPTRRNRTGPPKSRVSKSKKGSKARKDEPIKSEPVSESAAPRESIETPPPRIKQEGGPFVFDTRLTPRLTPGFTPGLSPGPSRTSVGPTMPNTPNNVIVPRFLTPCGDVDMFSPSPSITTSPTSDMLNSNNSFDFRDSPCPDPSNPAWSHGPPLNHFANAYPFNYGTGPCEQHTHMQPPEMELGRPIESNADFVDVKREDWDQY
ncbi:hypothetical protein GGR54DRAFT_35303 [Hypoxylon sp. NC1633]|nr:hypothetical protein GGR54DRAFT_35303 [Hypoxylon sp. NC1633]